MKEGQVIREYGFERSFNNRGWLISETETPQGATTRLSYYSRGRLIQKIKPHAVFLNYSYDALGRMISHQSSDGTIHYDSIYDRNDNLLEIHDWVHQTLIKREYDLFNRLVKEELSPTNILRYQYDLNDRLTELTLPDQSKTSYLYDSFHLKKITRTSADGNTYEIECHNYDLKGHLLNFTSPIGMTQFSYDLLNRTINIKTPYQTD
jgi:YD repeat-containing protein